MERTPESRSLPSTPTLLHTHCTTPPAAPGPASSLFPLPLPPGQLPVSCTNTHTRAAPPAVSCPPSALPVPCPPPRPGPGMRRRRRRRGAAGGGGALAGVALVLAALALALTLALAVVCARGPRVSAGVVAVHYKVVCNGGGLQCIAGSVQCKRGAWVQCNAREHSAGQWRCRAVQEGAHCFAVERCS